MAANTSLGLLGSSPAIVMLADLGRRSAVFIVTVAGACVPASTSKLPPGTVNDPVELLSV